MRLHARDVEGHRLPDWRMLLDALHARFAVDDYGTGLELVAQIGAAAEQQDHHPDLDLRHRHLSVRVSSHDTGGVTERDVRLARTISDLAGRLGAVARPTALQVLELALDTPDRAAVMPFWQALLALRASPGAEDQLDDPDGVLPTLWFQQSEPHPEPHQRWHLDLRLPPEVVPGRIAAALAAGGTLVTEQHAPAFWVLADPQGNRACLTTWQGRDER